MIPHPVLSEQLIHPFCFYCPGRKKVADGMRCQDGLYGLAYKFGKYDRLSAFALAEDLAIQDMSVIVTVSETAYKVWISLSSQEYPYWQHAEAAAQAVFKQRQQIGLAA